MYHFLTSVAATRSHKMVPCLNRHGPPLLVTLDVVFFWIHASVRHGACLAGQWLAGRKGGLSGRQQCDSLEFVL
jgi:hypothetical protein